jgi:hypothetical protein
MKCFVHRQSDAVGVCKSCSRALCPECVAEFPDGITCRGRCEQVVSGLNTLLARNMALAPSAHRIWYAYAIVMALLALMVFSLAVALKPPASIINLALGVGLLAVTVVCYRHGRTLRGGTPAA